MYWKDICNFGMRVIKWQNFDIWVYCCFKKYWLDFCKCWTSFFPVDNILNCMLVIWPCHLEVTGGQVIGLANNSLLFSLTCPVIFKAVEKMKDHHDQGMQRNQANVHLENTSESTLDVFLVLLSKNLNEIWNWILSEMITIKFILTQGSNSHLTSENPRYTSESLQHL